MMEDTMQYQQLLSIYYQIGNFPASLVVAEKWDSLDATFSHFVSSNEVCSKTLL